MTPWSRTYRVVFVTNLVTAVGMMSFLPFFPSYLAELGLQSKAEIATWSGLAFGAAPLMAAVMGPVWGSLGDRLGRKLMLVRAQLAILLFVGSMGLVRSPLELVLLRLGQGVFSGFLPPSITLVSVSAPREVQGRIAGTLQSALSAGSVLGPVAGAFLVAFFGLRSVFWFVAGAAGFAALAVMLFAHEDRDLRSTSEEPWTPLALLSGLRDDMRELFRNPRVRHAAVVLFFMQFGIGASNPLLELYVRDLWTGAPELVPQLTAALFTGLAIALLLSTPRWGRLGDRIGHARALRRGGLLAAGVLAAHALVPFYWTLLAVRVLLGATASGPASSAFGLAGAETPAERRGAAFGAMFSARAVGVAIGAISGGAIASVIGIRWLFVAVGVLLLLVLLRRRV